MLADDDARHGTTAGYSSKCRCDRCRAAWADYGRAKRATRDLAPDDPRHGRSSTYKNYGCRCDACRAAQAVDFQRAHTPRLGWDRGLTLVGRFLIDVEAFWSKVDKRGPDECWPWRGTKLRNGYGTFSVRQPDGRKGTQLAHRIAVLLDGRDIPDGMEIDHLCRRRDCENPADLDVVTRSVNVARIPTPPPDHGNYSTYAHGCRCDECRAAGRAYDREYRARRRPGV